MGLLSDLSKSGLTLRQVRDAIDVMGQLPVTVGGDLEHVSDRRGGTVITHDGRQVDWDIRLMEILSGDSSFADFSDPRYYVAPIRPRADSGDQFNPVGDSASPESSVIATNLAELTGGTHLMAAGERVLVFCIHTADGLPFYVFDRGASPVLVAVTGFTPTDDNGHYDTATITYGPGTGNACVVDNSNEAAWKVPGVVHKIHLLPVGWQGAGILYGTTADTPPKPKVRVSGQVGLDVLLTTDGGANASTVTGTATYTYTVKSHYGDTLLTGASPQWARPVGILTGPATKGYLQIDAGGNLMLAFTDEQAALVDCTT